MKIITIEFITICVLPKLYWAMIISTGTHLIPLQTIGCQHLLELLQHVVWHLPVIPLPADDNAPSIVIGVYGIGRYFF